jgi:hypothetical protein
MSDQLDPTFMSELLDRKTVLPNSMSDNTYDQKMTLNSSISDLHMLMAKKLPSDVAILHGLQLLFSRR